MMTSRPFPSRLRRVLLAAGAAATLLTLPATAEAQLVQWTIASGGNDHWYEYVPAPSIFAPVSFATAQAAAGASTHLGLQGYLATVTSAAEQTFLNGAFSYLFGFGATSTTWLGASDAAVEGEWRWLGGPEAGQLVGYTDWIPGHPVNAPGFEDYDFLTLYINAAGTPPVFGWASAQSSGALGYIVEYGAGSVPAVPEPSTAVLLAAGLVMLGWTARARRRTA